jgi:long-chain acyl-CoA synthetase
MTNREWSYGLFYDWSKKAATLLKKQGVNKGDHVAILLANSAEFAAMYFGCLFLGAVAVPVNQALHPEDIQYILEHSRVKLVVFSRCTRPLVLQATEKIASLRQVLIVLGQETSFHPEDEEESWSYDHADNDNNFIPLQGVTDDSTLLILFTSGTTGRPKGVVHSVRSEFSNAIAFNEVMQFGPENRFLHIWPMAYSTGYLNTLISPFMAAGSVVLSCAFTAQTILAFWNPVREYNVNTVWLSPTMIAALLRLDRDQVGINYCRNHIKTVCVGTAPLALKLKQDFEKKYGIECLESYGLSELLIISTNLISKTRRINSVGGLLEGVEFTTSDENGNVLLTGQEGEILIRTPYAMLGYQNAETGAIDINNPSEWFQTGDIGYIDLEGNVFITGRKKDIIIRGGQNISTRSIHDCLLLHQSVEDSVVVGIPHDFYGEEVATAIKLKTGLFLEDEQSSILEHCRKHLAQSAVPSKFIQVDEFPMGSTGKILNNEVRKLFLNKT